MRLVICPGIHDPKLTDCFLEGLSEVWGNVEPRQNIQRSYSVKIFPAHKQPPFSALDIFHFLCSQELTGESLVGWGVPLGGNFPIHRISHDSFTHWSSAILGGGEDSFYADRPVEHLDLWRSPQTAQGWQISQTADRIETTKPATAATFLVHLLKQYGVQSVV
ncbi:MAG: hypothetical protein EAZ88_09445 [Oscillatoriales cyanobacterium]|nr:MAG: hypothetical protein EAZ88_09445 [Oscillatoriales cyanobacterium]